MPFTEDPNAFTDVNEFGTAALWNGATTVNGIFERQFVDQMSVQTSAPTFSAPQAALAGVKQGDTFLINGTTFTVAEVQDELPMNNGWTLLLLRL